MTITAIKDLSDAAHGTVSYNGRSFNSFRHHKLESEDIWDEAGRTIVEVQYTLTVATTVFADTEAAMSTLMAGLRADLNEPGQRLVIDAVGLGTIIVDPQYAGVGTAPTHEETNWGPKPQVLAMNPVGGVRAIEIVWRCAFRISDCNPMLANQLQTRPLLACNYSIGYRTNKGLTTRNISGYLAIPQSRAAAGGHVAYSADQSWDGIVIRVPFGFERVENDRVISPDRNRLDFSITDRQLEGSALPPGIVEAEGQYSVGNSIAKSFESWNGTLEASFTVSPGVAKSAAAAAFYNILVQKLGELNSAVREHDSKAFTIIDKITARSGLFSQKAAFSASFIAQGCLQDILGPGGLWTPVEGTDYTQWATSMANVWGNRGTAGLRHVPSQDAIIDVCNPVAGISAGNDANVLTSVLGNFSGSIVPDIPADGGWIGYENRLVAYRAQSGIVATVLASFLPTAPLITTGVAMPSGVDQSTAKPVVQYSGAPQDKILMLGKALRIGNLPDVPRLVNVAGTPVTELKAVIDGPKVVSCFMNLKIYSVRWAILYHVDGYLNQIPSQPRKNDCCDDTP